METHLVRTAISHRSYYKSIINLNTFMGEKTQTNIWSHVQGKPNYMEQLVIRILKHEAEISDQVIF